MAPLRLLTGTFGTTKNKRVLVVHKIRKEDLQFRNDLRISHFNADGKPYGGWDEPRDERHLLLR